VLACLLTTGDLTEAGHEACCKLVSQRFKLNNRMKVDYMIGILAIQLTLKCVFVGVLAVHDNTVCGLVVRVPGYRSRGSGFIPGATRFL
jgi:hypothetical protein